MEVKVLSEKIKRIVSDHGVYEGKFYGINQYERGRQRFLKFFTNKWSSLTDKVIPSLHYNYVITLCTCKAFLKTLESLPAKDLLQLG